MRFGRGNELPAADQYCYTDIERDRQPKGSIYDGRASLEMIHAVYESARTRAAVELPMRNRRHPLAG